jgi:hypothetical protein
MRNYYNYFDGHDRSFFQHMIYSHYVAIESFFCHDMGRMDHSSVFLNDRIELGFDVCIMSSLFFFFLFLYSNGFFFNEISDFF